MKNVVKSVVLTMCLCLIFFVVPAHATIQLRIAHENAATHAVGVTLEEFAKRVSDRTNGEIEIKVYHASALGDVRTTIEAVQLGTLDMAAVTISTAINFIPEWDFLTLPFLFRDYNHIKSVINSAIGDEMIEYAKQRGFVVLGISTSGFRQLFLAKPATSLADLKDRKIRVLDDPIIISAWEYLGTRPVAVPIGEVYMALQTGVLDALETSFTAWINSKFTEVAPYAIRLNYMDSGRTFVLSSKVAERLGSKNVDILRETMREVLDEILWPTYEDYEVRIDDIAKENNASVSSIPLDEFRERLKPLYEKFIPTLGLEIIERIRNL